LALDKVTVTIKRLTF